MTFLSEWKLDELRRRLCPEFEMVGSPRYYLDGGLAILTDGSSKFVLKYDFSENDHSTKREINALQILEGLVNIPRLIDVYSADDTVGLLKTYVEGELLRGYLELSEEEYFQTRRLISMVHRKGVCDLDIRPDNIILRERIIYLFDFNTTQFLEDLKAEEFDFIARADLYDLGQLARFNRRGYVK